MSFASPVFLLLLFLVPLLASAQVLLSRRRARRYAVRFTAVSSLKQAAAAAYVERANVFYNAGQPMLYKYALRDFRLALRYDSNNTEAREKQDQIVAIYQQMGRPVPDLGNEP